ADRQPRRWRIVRPRISVIAVVVSRAPADYPLAAHLTGIDPPFERIPPDVDRAFPCSGAIAPDNGDSRDLNSNVDESALRTSTLEAHPHDPAPYEADPDFVVRIAAHQV